MEKEKWVEQIMDSCKGLRKLAPKDNLLDVIEARIYNVARVSPREVWIAAASIVFLGLLNVAAVKITGDSGTSVSQSAETSIFTTNQLY